MMLDLEEQDMLKAAREILASAPRTALVDKLLSTQADLQRITRQEKELDKKYAHLERTLDAVREVLYL